MKIEVSVTHSIGDKVIKRTASGELPDAIITWIPEERSEQIQTMCFSLLDSIEIIEERDR